MWFETIFLFGVLLGTFYFWLKYYYDYWTREGVTQIEPTLIVGNLGALLTMRKCTADFVNDIYNHPEAMDKAFVGIYIFHQPAIFVRDPDLVKQILMKDFSKFSDRFSNSNYISGDPIGAQNLFFLKNPKWKEIRHKLSPFFSSGKIKNMFYLIEKVGRNLDAHLLHHTSKTEEFILELKEFCALYTTDVIATVAYGLEANSFKDPNSEFRCNGRKVFKFTTKRAFGFLLCFFLPKLVSFFRFKVITPETTAFLRSTIKYVMEQRELSGKQRGDLIDILIDFKNWSQNPENGCKFVFDGDLLVAQAAIFFTAGFESSSATLSFGLYELAKHPDLQQRMRDEIKQALLEHDGQITQKLIDSLEFTQMVIYEVLRLYPPLPFLDRECSVNEDNFYDMKPFSKFKIPRGMPVYIPVYSLHMDPKYYPNPENFDPERFTTEFRKQHTPYTYMPFGLGPHACVGERLAMLQIKIGFVNFFRNHYVEFCDRTQPNMVLDPKALIVQAKGGIYLKVVRDPLNV